MVFNYIRQLVISFFDILTSYLNPQIDKIEFRNLISILFCVICWVILLSTVVVF